MSRHNRQRNKRHARGLWKVFAGLQADKPFGILGDDSKLGRHSVLDTILHRLDTTGKFPGWCTRVEREAIKRYGNIGNFMPEENTPF